MLFFLKKKSWRLFDAYSQTICLHGSDILCFSLHLRIPI
uniref:Photosystem II protein I n=1 Tax=Ulmus chenmoui TaxID=1737302 RepID=A0A4D6EV32_9ROSA|nr:photosystem II protein I [Ulmus chenmoui]